MGTLTLSRARINNEGDIVNPRSYQAAETAQRAW
jgi:hypothetical protein